jgi:hypothetical protein
LAEVSQGETWSIWLNRADQALYTAKHQGRNQIVNAPKSNAVVPTMIEEEPSPPISKGGEVA